MFSSILIDIGTTAITPYAKRAVSALAQQGEKIPEAIKGGYLDRFGLLSPARRKMNAVLKGSAFETWFANEGSILVLQRIIDFIESDKQLALGDYCDTFYVPDPAIEMLFETATLAEVRDRTQIATFERSLFASTSAMAFRDACENTTMSKPKELTGVVHDYHEYFVLGTDTWLPGRLGVLIVREYSSKAAPMRKSSAEREKGKADWIEKTKVAKASVGGWNGERAKTFLGAWDSYIKMVRDGMPQQRAAMLA